MCLGVATYLVASIGACADILDRRQRDMTQDVTDFVEYFVEGASCAGCAAAIEQVALSVLGISSARFSFGEMRLGVGYEVKKQEGEAELNQALSRFGFRVLPYAEAAQSLLQFRVRQQGLWALLGGLWFVLDLWAGPRAGFWSTVLDVGASLYLLGGGWHFARQAVQSLRIRRLNEDGFAFLGLCLGLWGTLSGQNDLGLCVGLMALTIGVRCWDGLMLRELGPLSWGRGAPYHRLDQAQQLVWLGLVVGGGLAGLISYQNLGQMVIWIFALGAVPLSFGVRAFTLLVLSRQIRAGVRSDQVLCGLFQAHHVMMSAEAGVLAHDSGLAALKVHFELLSFADESVKARWQGLYPKGVVRGNWDPDRIVALMKSLKAKKGVPILFWGDLIAGLEPPLDHGLFISAQDLAMADWVLPTEAIGSGLRLFSRAKTWGYWVWGAVAVQLALMMGLSLWLMGLGS